MTRPTSARSTEQRWRRRKHTDSASSSTTATSTSSRSKTTPHPPLRGTLSPLRGARDLAAARHSSFILHPSSFILVNCLREARCEVGPPRDDPHCDFYAADAPRSGVAVRL